MANNPKTTRQRTGTERRLITIDEAAEALALDPLTVRIAIARERLRVVYIGDSIRVPVEALEQFVAGLPSQPMTRRLRSVPARDDRRGE